MTIDYNGTQYLLCSNASIRQSREAVPESRQAASKGTIHAMCENALDLESNQKSSQCEVSSCRLEGSWFAAKTVCRPAQVVCDDVADDAAWTRFLSDCDGLTALSLTPPSVGEFEPELGDAVV